MSTFEGSTRVTGSELSAISGSFMTITVEEQINKTF